MVIQISGFAKVADEQLKQKIQDKAFPEGIQYANADGTQFVFTFPFEADNEIDARRNAIHHWLQQGAQVLELHVTEVG